MSIEALIFDVDGTLADTEEAHRLAFNNAFERKEYMEDYVAEDVARSGVSAERYGGVFREVLAVLADRLAGAQGVQMIAVIIGVCVPLFNVAAVWPMARHAGRGFVRELLRNPLIIGTTSGLLFNLAGGSIPVWMEPTVTRIGQASLALGLMAAGAGLQFGLLASAKTLGGLVLAVKHLGMPLMAFGIAQLVGYPRAATNSSS